MSNSRLVMVIISATALAASTVAPAMGHEARRVGCGSVITTDTTLTADLVGCTRTGLVVGADNITVNLNGHTISGDGVPAADDDIHFDYGLLVQGHSGVSVVNGWVDGFDRGVLFNGSPNGLVTAVHVRDNGNRGIMFDASDDATVRRNVTSDNGASGIAIVSSTDALVAGNRSHGNLGGGGVKLQDATGAVVTSNRFAGNQFGVQFSDGSRYNHVRHNRISRGEIGVIMDFSARNEVVRNHISGSGAGISLEAADHNRFWGNVVLHSDPSACDGCGIGIQVYGNDNLVAHNKVVDAPRYGIEIDDFGDPGHSPARNNALRGNLVVNAGEGIAIGPEAGGVVLETLIKHNRVFRAADDGIQLVGPSTGLETSTLTRNTANHNGDLGIEAVPGIHDGGGNRAAGNGNTLECLNVACR